MEGEKGQNLAFHKGPKGKTEEIWGTAEGDGSGGGGVCKVEREKKRRIKNAGMKLKGKETAGHGNNGIKGGEIESKKGNPDRRPSTIRESEQGKGTI